MRNETDDLVPEALARRAKQNGFDWVCNHSLEDGTAQPSYAFLNRWLREVRSFHLSPVYETYRTGWRTGTISKGTIYPGTIYPGAIGALNLPARLYFQTMGHGTKRFETWEEALTEAMHKAFKIIEDERENNI